MDGGNFTPSLENYKSLIISLLCGGEGSRTLNGLLNINELRLKNGLPHAFHTRFLSNAMIPSLALQN